MLALVGGDVFIHIAQFTFDNGQTLVDEHRSAYGDLVLVLHPVLVIYGYQHVQYILRTLDADVLKREVDDRGFLVTQRNGQVLHVTFRNGVQCGTGDIDRRSGNGVTVRRGGNHQPADRRLDSVVESTVDKAVCIEFITVASKLRQAEPAVR